ncbi:MAG: hypothetical protein U9N45_03320 [Gemmatimonadota bacterium]|nr:hypothetical protein [Gemmatimonadota bacterium]
MNLRIVRKPFEPGRLLEKLRRNAAAFFSFENRQEHTGLSGNNKTKGLDISQGLMHGARKTGAEISSLINRRTPDPAAKVDSEEEMFSIALIEGLKELAEDLVELMELASEGKLELLAQKLEHSEESCVNEIIIHPTADWGDPAQWGCLSQN